MASPTSSSSQPPPLPHRRPHLFTAIPAERKREEEDEANRPSATQQHQVDAATGKYKHHPTPLHAATSPSTAAAPYKKTHPANDAAEFAVSCNECRPSSREKTSVVPLDAARGGHGRSRSSSSIASPGHNGVLRSFFSAFTWRSPRPSCSSPSAGKREGMSAVGEEEWRLAATELSRRLIHATRKRDEALAEASRLKYSVAELERKLARLDSHCRDLKSALDRGTHHRPVAAPVRSEDFPLEPFLRAVSDARSAVRHLARSLAAQLRRDGDPSKAHGRLLQLIQQDERRGPSRGARGSSLLFHLEALLSGAFYEDFELAGFHRGGSDWVVDPRARAEANAAAYKALRGLSWDDVLSRGTRHYSEDFSRYCDRKMGQVAASALGGGWWGAWPEPLLRAFFEAAKGVWLVHLLAWSAHPPVPVFRVERGAPFDAGYMEDVAAPAGRPGPPQAPAAAVRMMVAPGFYVQGGVVKCKVLCMHAYNGKGSCDDKEVSTAKIRVNHGRRNDGSSNRMRR